VLSSRTVIGAGIDEAFVFESVGAAFLPATVSFAQNSADNRCRLTRDLAKPISLMSGRLDVRIEGFDRPCKLWAN
jgi:hypothetical protein